MEGKLVTTVVIVAIAIVVATVVGRVWSRRVDDRYRKNSARKIVHDVVVAVTLAPEAADVQAVAVAYVDALVKERWRVGRVPRGSGG